MKTFRQIRFKQVAGMIQPFYLAAVVTSILAVAGIAKADSLYFQAANGDWSTPANWSSGNEPIASDDAFIRNESTCTVSQAGAACFYLYAGNNTADTGTVHIISGDLTTTRIYIGNSGRGTYVQSGGTVDCERLYVGVGSSGVGICRQAVCSVAAI